MSFDTSVQRSFARVVFAFDSRLRRRNGVFDYVDFPDCILRVKLERAGRKIVLPDGAHIDPGDRILELHFRSEYFPPMGAGGATVAWARSVTKLMDRSLKGLCEYMDSRSELDDVAAIRAVMPLRSLNQKVQFERIASRFGFGCVAEPDTLWRWARGLGQNIVSLLLIMASNPRAARLDFLLCRGTPCFVSRRSLADRYRKQKERLSVDGLS